MSLKRKYSAVEQNSNNNKRNQNNVKRIKNIPETDDSTFYSGMDSDSEEQKDESSEENIKETPDEKRVRLAKAYLEKLSEMADQEKLAQQGIDGEKEEESEEQDIDKIGQFLKDSAFSDRTGRIFRFLRIADKIKSFELNLQSINFRKLTSSVTSVVVSEEHSLMYSSSKDCCIIKWEFPSFTKIATIKGHRKQKNHNGHTHHILALALSSDGELLASGGRDKIIKLWNTKENKLIDTFKGHRDAISALSFRVGTHDLYSASFDRSIKIWNCDNCSYIDTLFGHQSFITGIDSLRRERCITSSDDKTVRVWKIEEETQLVYQGPKTSQECVANITEEMWITGTQSGFVYLWTSQKKKPLLNIPLAHGSSDNVPNWISAIAALPFSDIFATGSCDGNIKLWCLEKDRNITHVKDIPIIGWINSLKFSQSGKYLIAGVSQDHRFGRWTKINNSRNGIAIIPLY